MSVSILRLLWCTSSNITIHLFRTFTSSPSVARFVIIINHKLLRRRATEKFLCGAYRKRMRITAVAFGMTFPKLLRLQHRFSYYPRDPLQRLILKLKRCCCLRTFQDAKRQLVLRAAINSPQLMQLQCLGLDR